MNSAVASLVSKDTLGNANMVMPTAPGGDVTLSLSDATTILKQASTGRIGILHHVLPVPDPAPTTVCMPEWDAKDEVYFSNENNCMLGDGGTTIVMTGMTSDGRSSRVTSVHRNPRGGSDIEIALDLWANGTGHVSEDNNPLLGTDMSVPWWYQPKPESFVATWVASLDSTGVLGTGLTDAGVTLDRGGVITVPGEAKIVPSPAPTTAGDPTTVNLTTTKKREDGFYMDGDTDNPQCVQNVREATDGLGGKVSYLQFAPATGTAPVEINEATAASSDGTAEDNTGGISADYTLLNLQNWVAAHNAVTGNAKIKTVTVRDGGSDGVGDDAMTTDTDEAANDVDRALPAVVCATAVDPADATTRYVGATLNISPTTTYCNSDNNRSATVYVLAYSAKGQNLVTPPIKQTVATNWRNNLNASTALTVHCPRSE